MIKTLAGAVRQYKKASILTPLFVIGEVILEVVIPLLMANLIDYGIDLGDMGYIVKMGAALLISALFTIVTGGLAGKFCADASCGFAKNLRADMYEKIQGFAFSNIDKYSASGLVTRMTTDVTNVQNAYMVIIRLAIRCPIMMIFSFIASFSIDASLSLIFLCCLPVLGVGLWLIIRKVHPLFNKVFRTYDKLNNVVQENLRGIRVVKSFTREPHEKEKFGAISESIYQDFTKAEKTLAFNMPLMQFCMYGCMLLVSWVGARAIVAAGGDPNLGLSTGELMSLISYAIQILMSLMMLSMVFVMITMARTGAGRIVEVLKEEPDILSPENAVTTMRDGSVEFDGVSFYYSAGAEAPALQGIDLHIPSGQTVGILGGTGSSKSTLVQLIPRLYDVREGAVLVGGVDVRKYDLNTLRDGVAMVLQKNELFSGTIKENLRWGKEDATDEELIHACKLAQADEFISAFPDGYDTYIEQGGANVSGGQKQRLTIARAILKNPKILILDDSTSAVDTKTDAQIRKAFREEIPGTTKIIIAQRVSSVEDADQIIMLDGGKIVAAGNHASLMKSCDIYQEIYNSQTRGGNSHEE